MPRVKLNQTKYKLTDFNKWLEKKMIDFDMNQVDVAELINIGQSGFSKKMKKNSFTLEEFIILANYFDANTEVEKLIIY